MRNYGMRNCAIYLYSHLLAKKKLPLQQKIEVTKGTYLTLLNRKNKNYIFTMSKSGKYWKDMVEDINRYGKITINTIVEEDDYLIFSLGKQSFKPSNEWISLR